MAATQVLCPTKAARVSRDLGEMLVAITWASKSGESSADILDPLIRPEIERRFAMLPKAFRDRATDRIKRQAEPATK